MIEIRLAQDKDALALFSLGRSTFIETFSESNTREDMELYLAETFSETKQLAEIRDAKRWIAMAWDGDRAVGFVHLLKGVPDPSVEGPRPIELLRLYVDANAHGKGVAHSLMNAAIEHALAENFGTLWLGVWEHNARAQAFYRKYDFELNGQHEFLLGRDRQVDLIMSRPLRLQR